MLADGRKSRAGADVSMLAITGGTPVRATPYPDWPSARRVRRRGGDRRRARRAGRRVSRAGAAGRGVRRGLRRLPGGEPRHRHGQRHHHDGGGAEGARRRLGRRGDHPRPHVRRHAVCGDGRRCAPGLRRRRARALDDRPRPVEAAVTPRTRAIMPVHLGQQMADMDRIMEIARRHDLFVVEDCAHAHGQRWRDQGAGCIGDFGSFCHQSTKILTSGEGGTLTTQRRAAGPPGALADRLRPAQGRRGAGVHVRRQLPARRAAPAPCS